MQRAHDAPSAESSVRKTRLLMWTAIQHRDKFTVQSQEQNRDTSNVASVQLPFADVV